MCLFGGGEGEQFAEQFASKSGAREKLQNLATFLSD